MTVDGLQIAVSSAAPSINGQIIPTTHCKPILAFGAGELFRACGVDGAVPDGQPDPGLIIALDTRAGQDDFVACHATHRHFARETDPPRV